MADLDASLVELYALMLRMPVATFADYAKVLGVSPTSVHGRVDRLVALGLARRERGRVSAVDPVRGLGRLLREHLAGLTVGLAQANSLVARLDALASEPGKVSRIRPVNGQAPAAITYPDDTITLVDGAHEGWRVHLAMALQAARPVDCALAITDPPRTDERLIWLAQLTELVAAGAITVRMLVTPAVPEAPYLAPALAKLLAAGARVRLHPALPSGLCLVGGQAALPMRWGDDLTGSGFRFYLLRSPVAVAAVRTLVDELWRAGTPYANGTDHRREVVRLLAQGLTDDAIARRLGVSARTVRARVAAALVELGARTRFQAGCAAARQGWLDG